MTLYAERKPSRHQPFSIIETRGSGKLRMTYPFPHSDWLTINVAESEVACIRGIEALVCNLDIERRWDHQHKMPPAAFLRDKEQAPLCVTEIGNRSC